MKRYAKKNLEEEEEKKCLQCKVEVLRNSKCNFCKKCLKIRKNYQHQEKYLKRIDSALLQTPTDGVYKYRTQY